MLQGIEYIEFDFPQFPRWQGGLAHDQLSDRSTIDCNVIFASGSQQGIAVTVTGVPNSVHLQVRLR